MKRNHFIRKQARVEMMPLIDTMFLLLVFLVYSMLSMVHHKGIDVDLPTSVTAISDNQDYDVLILTKDGEIFLNEEKVKPENFRDFLMKKFEKPKNASLYLRIDENLPYGRVIKVMDHLRYVGITKIFFEMDPQSSSL